MLNVVCEYKEWVEEDLKGKKHNRSGWELRIIHENGLIETQWDYPRPNDRDSWHPIKRYGGKFVCRTADRRANFVFKSQDKAQAYIDEWLMPRLIPRVMAGENIYATSR